MLLENPWSGFCTSEDMFLFLACSYLFCCSRSLDVVGHKLTKSSGLLELKFLLSVYLSSSWIFWSQSEDVRLDFFLCILFGSRNKFGDENCFLVGLLKQLMSERDEEIELSVTLFVI